MAKYYDLIYSHKDYASEAEFLRTIIHQYKESPGLALLDVGCGTGSHIRYLQESFEVIGSDISEDMLQIARSKNEGIDFIQSDMTELNLGRTFDVITCLFGAISYLEDEHALSTAISNFSKHLVTGGVLIMEPFLFPEDIQPNHVSIHCVDEPTIKLARVNNTCIEGNHLILNFHFLIATPESVEHYHDPNRMSIFSIDTFRDTLEKNRFVIAHVKPDWSRSGYFVGVKKE